MTLTSPPKRRTEALVDGLSVGSAGHRLLRLILLDLIRQLAIDQCFRCGAPIENVRALSIDHQTSWRFATDPQKAFFDLDNIAFSHLSCNARFSDGGNRHPLALRCKYGHPYNAENTSVDARGRRHCRACRCRTSKEYRQRNVALLRQRRQKKLGGVE